MSVDLVRLLQTMGGSLMAGTALSLREDYQQKTGLMLGVLLLIASEESDRIADRLVEENGALRELFRRAAAALPGSPLAERLAAAASGGGGSLRVSSLQPENHRLRALLIELHAHVEQGTSAAARSLDEEIWRELVRSNERRALTLSPL
jgi:hypothetical protein